MNIFQPKLIYLARRHPSLTREQFTLRWREHGQLGMSLPRWRNIARYVHCDLQAPVDGTSGISDDYDAIGMVWHKSPTHRAAHLSDGCSKGAMEADELKTFSTPIAEVCLVAREEIVLAPMQPSAWKLTRFSRDSLPAPFVKSASGYVRNRPLPPERGQTWGLGFALVEEFWFSSRDEAEDAAAGLRATGLVTIGRDVQLYP